MHRVKRIAKVMYSSRTNPHGSASQLNLVVELFLCLLKSAILFSKDSLPQISKCAGQKPNENLGLRLAVRLTLWQFYGHEKKTTSSVASVKHMSLEIVIAPSSIFDKYSKIFSRLVSILKTCLSSWSRIGHRYTPTAETD